MHGYLNGHLHESKAGQQVIAGTSCPSHDVPPGQPCPVYGACWDRWEQWSAAGQEDGSRASRP